MMSTGNNHVHQGQIDDQVASDQFMLLLQDISSALNNRVEYTELQPTAMEYQEMQVVPENSELRTVETVQQPAILPTFESAFQYTNDVSQQNFSPKSVTTTTLSAPLSLPSSDGNISMSESLGGIPSTELNELAAHAAFTGPDLDEVAVSPSDFNFASFSPTSIPTTNPIVTALLNMPKRNADVLTTASMSVTSTTTGNAFGEPSLIPQDGRTSTSKKPKNGAKRKKRRKSQSTSEEPVPNKISAKYDSKWESLSPDYCWDVTLGYYSVSVLENKRIDHADGCLIFHHKTFARNKLPQNITMIKMPSADTAIAERLPESRIKTVRDSLEVLTGGLRLELLNGEGIYATRYSGGHIYWTNTEKDVSAETEKLELKTPTLVFNIRKFREKLRVVLEKKLNKQPYEKPVAPLIWFTFTRKWKRDICECSAIQAWAVVKPLSLRESVDYMEGSMGNEMECDIVMSSDLKAVDQSEFSSY